MPDIDIDFSGARARAGDPLRDRQVRARVGRADRHLRQDVPARGHARRGARARPRLRRRRPAGQAHPRPDHGPPAVVRGLPEARASRCERRYDEDPQAKQIVDVAQGLEGIVRNSSIHAAAVVIADRPLTDIVPLQLADAGSPARTASASTDGHAVLDEADRGDRPAQDGLPGPAQPRRDRGRARHHRALDGRRGPTWRRCRSTTRRPTRCSPRGDSIGVFQFESEGMREALRRCARRSSRTSSRSTRSTARARWTRSRPTRGASATPSRSPTPTSACARSSRRPRA